MQCCIIYICDQTCYTEFLSGYGNSISHLYADIIRMHTVDGNFICLLRKLSVQNACLVDCIRFGINTDGSIRFPVIVIVFLLIPVKIFVNLRLYRLKIRIVQLIFFFRFCIFVINLIIDLPKCFLVCFPVCLIIGCLISICLFCSLQHLR